MSDLVGVIPELILVAAAIGVLFLSERWAQALALAGLVGGLASLVGLPEGTYFSGTLRLDAFSDVFQALFLAMSLLIALGSQEAIRREPNQAEYYALLLFATAGMCVVASAQELITLFVGFELASLSTYAMAGFCKRDLHSTEAATKFFIIGALSSGIALYGISLLYGTSGTTAIAALGQGWGRDTDGVFLLGMALVLVGFGFKVTAAPLHLWAPDAYQGAPTPVSALLATGSKKMGFAALFKVVLVGLLAVKLQWAYLLGAVAVLTMTWGNLAALPQQNVKRLLAYSSVAQAGYLLIAFPVASAYGLAGGIFHAITHSLMTAGAFLLVAALSVAGLGETLEDYKGLFRRSPHAALAMAVFLLSLAGIPPLAGFASKFVLFSSAVQGGLPAGDGSNGNGWLIGLAVAGVLNSALSFYYYARVLKAMYVDLPTSPGPSTSTSSRLTIPARLGWAVGILAGLVVLFGLYPSPLIEASLAAAQALLP